MADYARDFVKVPRGVLRELVHDHNTLAVYLIVLDRARYSEGRGLGPGGVVLNAGECVIGRDELAIASGITPAQVRTALDRLQKLEIVAIKTTSRGTIVTLVGYGETTDRAAVESPAKSPTNRQRVASQSPANRQRVATNREERRGDGKTSTPVSLTQDLSPPSPVGLKPPAGGKAEAEAQRRIEIGELSNADVAACWSYCARENRKTDKAMLGAIRSQRPQQAWDATRRRGRDGRTNANEGWDAPL